MKMSLEGYLFKETELPLFEFIDNHVTKYGKVPSQITIEGIAGLEDAIVEAPEPPHYYCDEVEKRYLHNSLKATVQEVSGILQDAMPEAAMDVLMRYTAQIYQKRRRRSLFDFRQAKDLILDAYLKQKTMANEVSMPYGWQTLDDMSGGMREGDFVTFVGRPMAGKTFKLLYTAHNAWTTGRVPLFVSMEMMVLIITQRIASMHTKKKLTDLIKAELSTKAFNAMMQGLEDVSQSATPMWITDGNLTSTVDDIVMLCHQLNPSAVFVDGAYLMDNPDPKLSKWAWKKSP